MDFSIYTAAIASHCTADGAGQICFNQAFEDLLQINGCASFETLFNFSGGECIKEQEGLEIRKITLGEDSFFLKKHWQPAGGASFTSEGQIEFNEYVAFREKGLATPIPVACGEKQQGKMRTSFLLTQDFTPLVDLEGIVLTQPEVFGGEENGFKRRNVLAAIGRYARKMHDAGCNQKDFNATHILLGDVESLTPQVALFDLQRVDRNPWHRLRWPVKALGELLFTLPAEQFDAGDHLFLFQSYIGSRKLSFLQRLLYRWILAKRNRIARHSRKRNLAPKMG